MPGIFGHLRSEKFPTLENAMDLVEKWSRNASRGRKKDRVQATEGRKKRGPYIS